MTTAPDSLLDCSRCTLIAYNLFICSTYMLCGRKEMWYYFIEIVITWGSHKKLCKSFIFPLILPKFSNHLELLIIHLILSFSVWCISFFCFLRDEVLSFRNFLVAARSSFYPLLRYFFIYFL